MQIKLVVVKPFAGWARGDTIADPDEAAKVLAGEQAGNVVRVLTEREES